jgi:hypothetical protein
MIWKPKHQKGCSFNVSGVSVGILCVSQTRDGRRAVHKIITVGRIPVFQSFRGRLKRVAVVPITAFANVNADANANDLLQPVDLLEHEGYKKTPRDPKDHQHPNPMYPVAISSVSSLSP